MPLAVEVADLVKTYGPLRAVDGVSFRVETGQIFGLLGPNGAGKSTTVEMVEGLRPADSGKIEVLGIDVRREPRRVKERIGVQLQTTAFFKQLSARQLLALFGSFFPRALPVEQLIAAVNLEEKPTRRAATFPAASGSGSPSRLRWSTTRPSSSSTNRPPASTRRRAGRCGR